MKYSYVGECNGPGVDRGVHTEMISSVNSSYNITGLGEYFNYSINLTAINDTGRSPPNIAFALTNCNVDLRRLTYCSRLMYGMGN